MSHNNLAALDNLLLLSGGGATLPPAPVSSYNPGVQVPVVPVVPAATNVSPVLAPATAASVAMSATAVTTPILPVPSPTPLAVPAVPGAEVVKPKRTRKPKVEAAPPEPVVVDPPIVFTPQHVASMGPAAGGPQVDAATFVATGPLAYAPATAIQPQAPATQPVATTAPRGTMAAPTFADLASVANGVAPAVQASPQPQHLYDDTTFDEDAVGTDDSEDSCNGQWQPVTANQQPAAPVYVQAAIAPAPIAQPQATAPQAHTPVAPPLGDPVVPDAVDDIAALTLQREALNNAVARIDRDLCLIALIDKEQWDRNSPVAEAYHVMKFEPHLAFTVTPQKLCEWEMAVAANAATVQSYENHWRAKHKLLGRDLDRIMFIRREACPGASKGEKENNLLVSDPAIRKLRNDYLVSERLKEYLENMGERLTVVANGIKRAISFRIEEFKQSNSSRHTP